jgi:hypothetical protein
MTHNEFNDWFVDYCTAFPETGAWLNAFSPENDTEGRRVKAILERWRGVFEQRGVRLSEAKSATAAMLRGDAECVKAFDREQTPAIVAKLARELRGERRRDTPQAEPLDDQTGPVNLGGIFRELVKLHVAGASPLEREKLLAVRFGGGASAQRRYKCAVCLDTGLISCVSAGTTGHLRRMADGALPIVRASAGCTCERGQERVANSVKTARKETRPLAAFNALEHVRIRDTEELTRAGCSELLAERAASKRHSEFDQFNQRNMELV